MVSLLQLLQMKKIGNMNERIRELWAQCVNKHTKTPMNWQNAADEFAELIVKDCCEWIDGAPSTEAGEILLTKSFIIVNLKDRFGVK